MPELDPARSAGVASTRSIRSQATSGVATRKTSHAASTQATARPAPPRPVRRRRGLGSRYAVAGGADGGGGGGGGAGGGGGGDGGGADSGWERWTGMTRVRSMGGRESGRRGRIGIGRASSSCPGLMGPVSRQRLPGPNGCLVELRNTETANAEERPRGSACAPRETLDG